MSRKKTSILIIVIIALAVLAINQKTAINRLKGERDMYQAITETSYWYLRDSFDHARPLISALETITLIDENSEKQELDEILKKAQDKTWDFRRRIHHILALSNNHNQYPKREMAIFIGMARNDDRFYLSSQGQRDAIINGGATDLYNYFSIVQFTIEKEGPGAVDEEARGVARDLIEKMESIEDIVLYHQGYMGLIPPYLMEQAHVDQIKNKTLEDLSKTLGELMEVCSVYNEKMYKKYSK